jgi:hypothetical protein
MFSKIIRCGKDPSGTARGVRRSWLSKQIFHIGVSESAKVVLAVEGQAGGDPVDDRRPVGRRRDAVSHALTFLNAFIFGTPEIFVGLAHTTFDEKMLELKDDPLESLINRFVEQLSQVFMLRSFHLDTSC